MLYRDRISRLAALALFLSAVEMFIPRFVPFFRIGLANIPILQALNMDAGSFLILLFLKGIGTSYISGNLFSIFAIVSIAQSLVAGGIMYMLKRAFPAGLSIYGISLAGALGSSFAQIALTTLYAGKGTLAFLPLMLILSIPSALITAALSEKIPEPRIYMGESSEKTGSRLPIILLIATGAAMMMYKDLEFIIPAVILSFLLQKTMKRRIYILPHLTMLLFMMISSLLTPHGEVLFRIFSYPVTEGAIIDGLSKALKLSGGIALSQAFSTIIRPQNGLIGKTISMFTQLLTAFHNTEGNLWTRFTEALTTEEPSNETKRAVNIPYFTLICISALITALAITDCVFF